MTNELKAMFWTMGLIVAVVTFVFLVAITEGIAVLVALGLLVIWCIYKAVLGYIDGRWRFDW